MYDKKRTHKRAYFSKTDALSGGIHYCHDPDLTCTHITAIFLATSLAPARRAKRARNPSLGGRAFLRRRVPRTPINPLDPSKDEIRPETLFHSSGALKVRKKSCRCNQSEIDMRLLGGRWLMRTINNNPWARVLAS